MLNSACYFVNFSIFIISHRGKVLQALLLYCQAQDKIVIRKTLPLVRESGVACNVFLWAGSRRCSVALLSIFYQERGRKHFSIRDEAPLDPELEHLHHLLQRSRIYPGFTPHQLPDKNCSIKNRTLIEISVFKISWITFSGTNIYFFSPHTDKC